MHCSQVHVRLSYQDLYEAVDLAHLLQSVLVVGCSSWGSARGIKWTEMLDLWVAVTDGKDSCKM